MSGLGSPLSVLSINLSSVYILWACRIPLHTARPRRHRQVSLVRRRCLHWGQLNHHVVWISLSLLKARHSFRDTRFFVGAPQQLPATMKKVQYGQFNMSGIKGKLANWASERLTYWLMDILCGLYCIFFIVAGGCWGAATKNLRLWDYAQLCSLLCPLPPPRPCRRQRRPQEARGEREEEAGRETQGQQEHHESSHVMWGWQWYIITP